MFSVALITAGHISKFSLKQDMFQASTFSTSVHNLPFQGTGLPGVWRDRFGTEIQRNRKRRSCKKNSKPSIKKIPIASLTPFAINTFRILTESFFSRKWTHKRTNVLNQYSNWENYLSVKVFRKLLTKPREKVSDYVAANGLRKQTTQGLWLLVHHVITGCVF